MLHAEGGGKVAFRPLDLSLDAAGTSLVRLHPTRYACARALPRVGRLRLRCRRLMSCFCIGNPTKKFTLLSIIFASYRVESPPVDPTITAVPIWGQSSQTLSSLSPKRDCGTIINENSPNRGNPFSTAVPFWGQTTWNLTGLSRQRHCSSKRVNAGTSEDVRPHGLIYRGWIKSPPYA